MDSSDKILDNQPEKPEDGGDMSIESIPAKDSESLVDKCENLEYKEHKVYHDESLENRPEKPEDDGNMSIEPVFAKDPDSQVSKCENLEYKGHKDCHDESLENRQEKPEDGGYMSTESIPAKGHDSQPDKSESLEYKGHMDCNPQADKKENIKDRRDNPQSDNESNICPGTSKIYEPLGQQSGDIEIGIVEVHHPKERFLYKAPWQIYSMNWSSRPDPTVRLAIGSFLEGTCTNELKVVTLNEDTSTFEVDHTISHVFPPTKVMFIHDTMGIYPDLIASSSQGLLISKLTEEGPEVACMLRNRYRELDPMTSFDWSTVDPNLIGSSNHDSSITIWGIETRQEISHVGINKFPTDLKYHFSAHDSAVYDIAFNHRERNLLATVGDDRTVQIFDLRDIQDSQIEYKSPEYAPLVRLAWNIWDSKYLAIIPLGSNYVQILDCRVPVKVIKVLKHQAAVNGLAWASNVMNLLGTAGDDHNALVWDVSNEDYISVKPLLAYSACKEIEQIRWSTVNTNQICISHRKTIEVLEI